MGVANWGCAVPYSLFIDVQPTALWTKVRELASAVVWVLMCGWNLSKWGCECAHKFKSTCVWICASVCPFELLYLYLCIFHALDKVTCQPRKDFTAFCSSAGSSAQSSVLNIFSMCISKRIYCFMTNEKLIFCQNISPLCISSLYHQLMWERDCVGVHHKSICYFIFVRSKVTLKPIRHSKTAAEVKFYCKHLIVYKTQSFFPNLSAELFCMDI